MAEEWDRVLTVVAGGPRENGSEALQQASLQVADLLRQAGLEPQLWSYMAQPYRLRLAGLVALLGSLLYAGLLWRGRAALALVCALALPVLLLAELDGYVPLFGWIGAQEQVHVEATLNAPQAVQHLILAAHLDSKTDLLDHVERAPAEVLALPVALLMVIAAAVGIRRSRRTAPELTRSWLTTVAAVLAVLNGMALFASLSAGAFVSRRSHGALDDGAACGVLVRLAERLAAAPPERTDVTFLILSGEEIGVFGSWVYARDKFAAPPQRPTAVINLEFIGATADMGVFAREAFSLRSFTPDPRLLDLLDEVHQQRRGKPLYRFPYPAGTDGRSFLAHGVSAATIFNDLPEHALPRDLHSAADRRELLNLESLDVALEYLQDVVRTADRRGL